MSVESILFDAVKGLVSNRAYPDFAPANVQMPYITYQQISGRSVVYTTSELPNKKNGRFQFNVWATTRAQANSISLAIEAALIALTTVQAEPLGSFTALSDKDLKTYGAMQDFSVWSDR